MRSLLFALTALTALVALGCSQPESKPETAAATESSTPTETPDAAKASEESKTVDGKPVAGPPSPPPGSGTGLGPEVAKLGAKAVKTKSGLQFEDLVVGSGSEAKDGKTVKVHYTGWLTDGTKFDSSLDRGEPFELSLPGQVIKGWNEGIPGMKVGGKRKLLIPPDLGYGASETGPIPANSTLVFEVELLQVD